MRQGEGINWWHQMLVGVSTTLLVIVGAAVLVPSQPALAETALTSPVPVGAGPEGVTVNQATHQVYVANSRDNTVTRIDGTTNTVAGSPIAVGQNPNGIAVNASTNQIYVANFADNTVTRIDGATNTVAGDPIKVDVGPAFLTADPLENRVYVPTAAGFINIIDGATNTTVGAHIPIGPGLSSVGFSFRRSLIYVSRSPNNTVTAVNPATHVPAVPDIAVGRIPTGVVLNPATESIYVANGFDNTVSVINGENFVVSSLIPVGSSPELVAVNAATNRIYVANAGDGTVSVIDGVTNAVIGKPVPAGRGATGVAVDPTTNRVYVSNADANTVSVIGIPFSGAASPLPPGNTVAMTWSSLFGPNGGDFIGLYAPATSNSAPLSQIFTNGTASPGGAGLEAGTARLAIPTNLPMGKHEIRLVSGASGGTLAVIEVIVPAATNESFTVAGGGTLSIPAPGVLANDNPAGSPPLQAAIVTNPAHGTLVLQPNGAFTYTPHADFSGSDSFVYQATNKSGMPAAATVTITVTPTATGPGPQVPGNAPPTAVGDTFTVQAQTTLTIPAPGLLANDTDPDSRQLSASVADKPGHGNLTISADGAFTYQPGADFAGTDSFTYRTSDGTTQSAPATVTIAVAPTACGPRPRIQSTPIASGSKLQVHVEAVVVSGQPADPLRALRFGTLQNAKVTLNGQQIASGQTFTVPAEGSAVDFTVERATPGQATTVPFTVVDGCGEWQTFVGGGTAAGF
jgi:YVTN family beta-propeller protein/VCBS repeat-containing protein